MLAQIYEVQDSPWSIDKKIEKNKRIKHIDKPMYKHQNFLLGDFRSATCYTEYAR